MLINIHFFILLIIKNLLVNIVFENFFYREMYAKMFLQFEIYNIEKILVFRKKYYMILISNE